MNQFEKDGNPVFAHDCNFYCREGLHALIIWRDTRWADTEAIWRAELCRQLGQIDVELYDMRPAPEAPVTGCEDTIIPESNAPPVDPAYERPYLCLCRFPAHWREYDTRG